MEVNLIYVVCTYMGDTAEENIDGGVMMVVMQLLQITEPLGALPSPHKHPEDVQGMVITLQGRSNVSPGPNSVCGGAD